MKFYLSRDDKAKALDAEVVTLKKAIDDTKDIITDLKVELAKATGTLTGSQQSMVDARATIQVLSANCKARNRIGLINF
jgi:predicted  nucleic acid-binding Zn-ribbon protein